jgi:hypothetical protein
MTTIANPTDLSGDGLYLDSEQCQPCIDEQRDHARGVFYVTDNITSRDEREALKRDIPSDPERVCRRCGLRERSAS